MGIVTLPGQDTGGRMAVFKSTAVALILAEAVKGHLEAIDRVMDE